MLRHSILSMRRNILKAEPLTTTASAKVWALTGRTANLEIRLLTRTASLVAVPFPLVVQGST